ncbi:MAG TPA: DUF5682 family protein, partial [Saprospiraceae bacterium]|nr:DUF5682 family protein [Saprospiraceae bacterium]
MPTLFAPTAEADTRPQDPFGEIASLAGYTDPERWWEAMFERSTTLDPFPVVLELMQALRDSKNQPESPETLLREAYMRQTIRAARQAGAKNLAVVCGAWHTPALADWEKIKASADAALLKGLKKVKTEATWIPWSFDRLSVQSGYAAGVLAPAWYRVLWENPPSASAATAATVWLSAAARLLREHDVETSSAHIIEAVRLAHTLAALRGTQQPGIEELRQAAVAVMGLHSDKPLELLDAGLVVGDVLGRVPDALPMPPLKADFEAQAKSCRLERSTAEKLIELDLRKDSDLRKSVLLHRVALIGIGWGTPTGVGGNRQGRFHEHWLLKWLPDYEIRFIEAGTWGNTVEMAAAQLTLQRIGEAEALPALSALLEQLMQADLPAVLVVLL